MPVTVADLVARSDKGSFVLTTTPDTPLVSGAAPIQTPHPQQALVPHGSAHRTAYGWSAVYRTRRLAGDVLVVDSAVAASYLQMVLDHVWTAFDVLDLRMGLVGYPPNTHQGLSPGTWPNPPPGAPPTGVPD